MVGVSGRADLGEIQGFIEARGVGGFPHIADESGDVWAAFDILTQPAFVFIDDDGTVVASTGTLGSNLIAEQLDALIAS